jgi:hypothetical protein
VTASLRVIDAFRRSGRNVLRVLGASGQLGYGVPTPTFQAGLAREPDIIGCDMGSIDIGPYYLGAGQMATAPAATRRDLRKVILAARKHDIPLVIGSAGSAGAGPHLDATLAIVRDIAREDGLHFRLGVLRADMPRDLLHKAVHAGEVHGIDGMPPLTLEEVDAASEIVGQMGSSAFQRGLAAGVDVLIAGRACDTGIFASLPIMLGLPAGLAWVPDSWAQPAFPTRPVIIVAPFTPGTRPMSPRDAWLRHDRDPEPVGGGGEPLGRRRHSRCRQCARPAKYRDRHVI